MSGTFAARKGISPFAYAMYRNVLLFLFPLCGLAASAQQATITGTVTTNETGRPEPLPFVSVVIKGTTTGASTDLDGKYFFKCEPGTHTIAVSFVGYRTMERIVELAPGSTNKVDIELPAEGVQMEAFEVVRTVDREREGVLLMERKESTALVQHIGAAELKKKGAGDVAEGVQKMVGLSVVGNKYVVVRGLGDRYNSAYLNGLPLPSPDPDTKVAPLDIFPTDVVGSIAVTKGFTPDLYGDFSGGAVDIVTKRATGDPVLKLSLGGGMNSMSTFKPFTTYEGGNGFWGRDDGTRALPSGVLGEGVSLNDGRQRFTPNFDPRTRTAAPDMNFGLFGGTSIAIKEGVKLNVLATANYRNESRYREGQVRIINTLNLPLVDYDQRSWQFNTQTSALGALSLELGRHHTITAVSTWVNLSSDEVRINEGRHFDYQDDVYARRMTYRQNTLWINQLSGRHAFGEEERLTVDWAGSMSTADAAEPDRRQLVYLHAPGATEEHYRFNAIDRLENHRWYSALEEEETSARAGLSYRLLQRSTEEGVLPVLTLRTGAQMKRKERLFGYDIFSYDLALLNSMHPNAINVNTPDQYLSGSAFADGDFQIDNVTGPEADHRIQQDINAVHFTGEFDVLPSKLKLLAGVRVEQSEQALIYRKQSDSFYQPMRRALLVSDDVLPFASVKYDVTTKQVVRASASKTISRPGFREMGPFEYTEFFAGTKNVGNPDLRNGTNYNADLRYEVFGGSGEVIAVGVFGKLLEDPIEKVALATASGQLQSFRNTGSATVAGVEFEFVKNLGSLLKRDSTMWNDLSVGMNATFLHSELRIDAGMLSGNDGANIVLTNTSRPLQGASPYLLNADVSYAKRISDGFTGTFTVAYNVFGRRVFAAGANGLGDQYELPVGMLNVIMRGDIGERWQANITMRNVLDARSRIEQETPHGSSLLNDYRTGIGLSAGITYRLL